MKLKHRLALYSIVIFSVVILIASVVIYLSFYAQMERKETQSLQNKTLLAAIYYFEQDELPTLEHENIRQQLNKAISRSNIVVYNVNNRQSNGEMPHDANITTEFVEDVRERKSVSFTSAEFFYNGIFYPDNEGDFVVVTRESRAEFDEQMQSLLNILITVSIIGLVFIYLFSNFLALLAYQPIARIMDQIRERDTENFGEPLVIKESYAEIEELVQTYNHFIDRVAQTFSVQKNFIDYVSHELRTPITALLGTLEVTGNKKRTVEQHEVVIQQLKQYTNDLQETLDQMMLLSGVKTNFEHKSLRIDEVVWQVIENATLYHQAKINVVLEVKNNDLLVLFGNEKLLEIAFNNLLSNAIKYSGNQAIEIRLLEIDNQLHIHIIDQGIGILPGDLNRITQNFYRGQNTKDYNGKGIGLSMAHVILTLHNIQLEISPNQPRGTVVKLRLF